MSDTTSKSKPGCFRIGCCSCLLLVLLMVGGLLFIGGSQYLFERGSGPRREENVVRELPSLLELQRLIDRGEIGDGGQRLDVEPRQFSSFAELLAASDQKGVIKLQFDLNVGEFEIIPGEPGAGVQLEASYDERAFRFTEDFTEGADGGGVLRIRSAPRGGMLGLMFRGAGNGPKNFLTVKLPPGVPFDLAGSLGLGESKFELGGLLIRSLDLKLGMGDHEIVFSKPLAAPMDSFTVEKGIGSLRVDNLGNASPREVEIDQSLGEMYLGLRGAWQNDAHIEARNGIGELEVEASDTAHIRLGKSGLVVGEKNLDVPELDLPEGAPTLELSLSGAIGDITIHSH